MQRCKSAFSYIRWVCTMDHRSHPIYAAICAIYASCGDASACMLAWFGRTWFHVRWCLSCLSKSISMWRIYRRGARGLRAPAPFGAPLKPLIISAIIWIIDLVNFVLKIVTRVYFGVLETHYPLLIYYHRDNSVQLASPLFSLGVRQCACVDK